MSTEVSILSQANAGLPAHLQQYQQEAAQQASELVTGFSSLPKISLKGKQFRFVKDDKEVVYPMGQPLKCVILAADPPSGTAKAWYEEAYDGDTAELPDCFSSDGFKPDGLAAKPQCRSCTECPKNAFGSAVGQNGKPGKGKACADVKNLFVVEAHSLDKEILVVRVPATSLKALSAYGRELGSKNVPTPCVVTQLSFTDAEYPVLEFQAVDWLSAEDSAACMARAKSDELRLALPSNNITERRDGETPAPVTDAAALPAPAPEVETKYEWVNEQFSRTQLEKAGWTEEQMIAKGYLVEVKDEPTPPTPPAPPEPPTPEPPVRAEPVKVMTEKAKGAGYDAFIANCWTDEQLIKQGYMELK